MGLFSKFKAGLAKTHSKLAHEIKRIVTLLAEAGRGVARRTRSRAHRRRSRRGRDGANCRRRETRLRNPGRRGTGCVRHRPAEVEKGLGSNKTDLIKAAHGPTVVSIVGVNGTGKTTTAAKLAHLDSSAEENRVAGRVRHVSRRRHRANQTLGAAVESRSGRRRLRRGCGVRGARRRHRRAGAQGGLSVH